ncbi:MAG TPA: hypothetical protein VK154_02510 [Chitinophagales bacterium]|nr:hypothetical protein [Chitinophagales bacterium]
MRKKILVLYYTQTGQLADIVNSFLSPFSLQDVSIETVRVKPVKDFDFPWNSERFFEAMPESVLAIPAPLQPFELKDSNYDLVVFAYQPWYLSLSIPANSILAVPAVKAVLKNTPVVTLIGARNMWISSQEKLKKILKEAGAKLVGNIALVDKNNNLASALTILHWMMSGKKTRYLGVFPLPGVQDEDVKRAAVFGQTVLEHLQKGNFDGLQTQLVKQQALEVKKDLMFIEERAPRLFSIWANIIVKRKNRKAWLVVFKYYLLFALFIVAPIVLTINAVFFRPFFANKVARKREYYLGLRETKE